MGLSLSLPMQAMMYGALEKTAVGVFICGSIAMFLISNNFIGILRVKPKVVTSSAAVELCFDNRSSNRRARVKSLVSGVLPSASGCADSKSLFKGVIPYGDEERSSATLPDDDNSPRALSDADRLFWNDQTKYGYLPVIDEEDIDGSFEFENDLESNFVAESHLDKLFGGDRDWFDEQIKTASHEDLVEMGESLFLLGEMLHVNGKRADALRVYERASVVQKLAIEQVMETIASLLRKVGVYHRDRGDDILSVVMVGAADLLHAKPSPTCLLLCTQVLRGYQQSNSTCPDLEALMKEMNGNIELARREAKPLALSLRGQANSHSH